MEKYRKELLKTNFKAIPQVEMSFWTLQKTPSRALMSRLNHSSNSDEIDVLLISNYYNDAKWIVVSRLSPLYDSNLYKRYYCNYTMTEFKKENSLFLVEELTKLERKPLLKISQVDYDVIIWKEPVVINAQTYRDMDFRKEWWCGELIYEGNNFGDTSDFYIIGTLYNK